VGQFRRDFQADQAIGPAAAFVHRPQGVGGQFGENGGIGGDAADPVLVHQVTEAAIEEHPPAQIVEPGALAEFL